MSIETWKSEFYPIDASDVPESDALAHSLRKWEGLTPENLAKHGIRRSMFGNLVDGQDQWFYVDDGSCALCRWSPDCRRCPLVAANGGLQCDQGKEGELSPYLAFTRFGNGAGGDPQPMIQLIKRAIEESNKV